MAQCGHLSEVKPVPSSGIDASAKCEGCGRTEENWVCLNCYKVLCSRYQEKHMISHNDETSHPVVLSLADLSTWCYGCDSYIDNDTVKPAKQAAGASKHGE